MTFSTMYLVLRLRRGLLDTEDSHREQAESECRELRSILSRTYGAKWSIELKQERTDEHRTE